VWLALGALLARGREPVRMALRRPPGRLAVGIVVWFLTGLVAFSAMERLQTRYLEAFAPAVCAVFALSLRMLWHNGLGGRSSSERRGDRASNRVVGLRILLVCVGLGLLTASLNKDAYVIRRARSDSLLTDFSTPALSRYLRAHRDGTPTRSLPPTSTTSSDSWPATTSRCSSSTAWTDRSHQPRAQAAEITQLTLAYAEKGLTND
jgi:hypothetical protein